MFKFSFYDRTYLKVKDFVGLENYIEVFTRDDLFATLKLSLFYIAGGFVDVYKRQRLWAAAELYAATGDASYLKAAEMYFEKAGDKSALGWTDVAGLAGWTFFDVDDVRADGLKKKFEQHFIDAADDFLKMGADCGYGAAMQCEDYSWGSNMVVLNLSLIHI